MCALLVLSKHLPVLEDLNIYCVNLFCISAVVVYSSQIVLERDCPFIFGSRV